MEIGITWTTDNYGKQIAHFAQYNIIYVRRRDKNYLVKSKEYFSCSIRWLPANSLSKSHRTGVFCVGLQSNPPPPAKIGTSHGALRNFRSNQHRISPIPIPKKWNFSWKTLKLQIWPTQNTNHPPQIPQRVNSYGSCLFRGFKSTKKTWLGCCKNISWKEITRFTFIFCTTFCTAAAKHPA